MNKVRPSQSLSSALRRDKPEKEKDRSIKADSVRGFKTQNLIEKRKKKKKKKLRNDVNLSSEPRKPEIEDS